MIAPKFIVAFVLVIFMTHVCNADTEREIEVADSSLNLDIDEEKIYSTTYDENDFKVLKHICTLFIVILLVAIVFSVVISRSEHRVTAVRLLLHTLRFKQVLVPTELLDQFWSRGYWKQTHSLLQHQMPSHMVSRCVKNIYGNIHRRTPSATGNNYRIVFPQLLAISVEVAESEQQVLYWQKEPDWQQKQMR
ncbi:hypothetical protein GCK72_022842 [Caenorhabditis remanei]|uniref:Uncharacterized protein n=1 Tax=Caenorhabditis remanei TaxID=31234 RepID=A0A6A5FUU7_CAERE|nr:hypothetical protein GCK72_022842 [Caenorhabditis remanei]KAF1746388.1 hypothetical protein GCK72_022842 [Caenorhabditis remanei]